MSKTRGSKGLVIALSVLCFLLLGYFGGGIVAERIVSEKVFGHRGSDESTLNDPELRVYRLRKDYPSLSIRTEHRFTSGNNELTGYRYLSLGKGTVVCAHGFGLLADGPESAYQDFFVSEGYDVFAIDLTASGKSEGQSTVSMAQSAYDVASAARYLTESGLIRGELILAGYSWGAYGVCQSLALGVNASKVIVFSGYETPYDEMLSSAVRRAGPIAYATVPSFALSTRIFGGDTAFAKASEALKSSSAKCFLVHGEHDETVPYGISVYAAMEGTMTDGYRFSGDHVTPWLSEGSKIAALEAKEHIRSLNGDEAAIQQYLDGLNRDKTSALNLELFEKIRGFIGA